MSESSPQSGAAPLAGKKVLVMGLGRFGGGVGVTQWLVREGAVVTVNDAAPAEELADSIRRLEGLPVTFKLGGHDAADFLAAELLVINPAVDKAKSAPVQAALARGIACTTEMNLFLERCAARAVGVTGSVGKSTTTALLYAAIKAGLRQADDAPRQEGPRVFLGGNIGRSLLLELPHIRRQDVVVLELSSFMLEETARIRWSPHIAVVTNVFPNHLDRHGTMAAYTAAKQNILRFQRPDDVAVLNADHELVARWTHLARGRVVKFTIRGPSGGRPALLIPGEHNASNAAAALAAADALVMPLDRAAALAAVEGFRGLSHRLELVHSIEVAASAATGRRTIRFYNDSKATSPEAAITALRALAPRSALFIVGGYDKRSDLTEFARLLAQRAAGVLTIGQTGPAIEQAVRGSGDLPAERVHQAGDLEKAMRQAYPWALADGGIAAVVLSPGCASWDQFANYEERGEIFARRARELA